MRSEFSRGIDHDSHDYQQASKEQQQEIDRIREEVEERKEELRKEQAANREADIREAAQKLSPTKQKPELRPWWARWQSRRESNPDAEREVDCANAKQLALIDRDAADKVERILEKVRAEKGIDADREAIEDLREQKQQDRAATRPEQEQSRPEPSASQDRLEQAYERAKARIEFERANDRDGRER